MHRDEKQITRVGANGCLHAFIAKSKPVGQ
jgi:hypothetical protein